MTNAAATATGGTAMCRRPVIALVVVIVSITCGQPLSGASPQERSQEVLRATTPGRILVRLRPTGSAENDARLKAVLNRFFQIETVSVDSGTDLESLVRSRCGRVDNAWMTTVARLNRIAMGARALDEAASLSLPPCPYWHRGGLATIPEGTTVDGWALTLMGTNGPLTMAQLAKANPDIGKLSAVSVGQELTLPYVSGARSYRVKAEYADRVPLVLSALMATNGVLAASADRELSLVTAGATPQCAQPSTTTAWPFDAARLVEVLEFNARKRARPPRKAIVAIADTGATNNETRLFLQQGPEPEAVDGVDSDENGYIDDVFGANMDRSPGFPSAQPIGDYPNAGHGTGVAGLALGGASYPALSVLVKDRIGLRILNLVTKETIGETRRYPIRTGAVVAALHYVATDPSIPIINLSVETSFDDVSMRDAIRNSQALVIVAAGNEMQDMDLAASFPAALRRSYPSTLISVASHDRGGALSSWSNRGRETVDIAAPGCSLRTLAAAGTTVEVGGTSFAAPLVTFTSALLYSEGLGLAQIKRRIMLSSDLDRSQLRDVASEGRLNIENALRVYQDVVTLRDPASNRIETLVGTIRESCITLDGRCQDIRAIKRLVPRFAGNDGMVWLQGTTQDVAPRPVTAIASGIRFQPLGEAERVIPIERIVNVLPAVYRPR